MSDHEEEFGEDANTSPPLDYNETDDEGFSKIEHQIYTSLMEAKAKHKAANPPSDDPEEEPEPFDYEGWLETFTEANPKIDAKRIKYVSVYGIYSGERDELQVRQGSGKYFSSNGDRYNGQYQEGLRNGHGFYEYRSLGIAPVDAEIHKYLQEDDQVKQLVQQENYNDAARLVIEKMSAATNQQTISETPSFHRVFYLLQFSSPYPFYDGEFKDNNNDGQGIMKYQNGNVYKGEWQDGQKHGYGDMYYANGDVYKGEWQQGRKTGSGSYFFSNFGCHFEGEWSDGKFVQGSWKMPDGIIYQGKFDDIPVDVDGQFVFGQGTRMRGEFRDGKFRPSNRFTVDSTV